MYTIRDASPDDIDYIASCYGKLSQHIKSESAGEYIDGLPEQVDDETLALAESYLDERQARALIAEAGGAPIACIATRIQPSSFPPSGVGDVGHIGLAWVEPDWRAQGVAAALLAEVEIWLEARKVDLMELSYLSANTGAETAWRALGFEAFRVHAYKRINGS
ncbi:MAG: GNAT family N-acetyltransferase [Pseudomonadota bacterium]